MSALFRLAVLGVLIALPVAVEGQQTPAPGKPYRLGVLANALDTADGPSFQAFLDSLRKLGYVENGNIIIEWRSSEGESARLPALAAELVRAKVDVILATALVPALAATEATKTIPIVFVVGADPVAHKLVGNLNRPGGNATGLAAYLPDEIGAKVFQLLREVVPRASRVGVLSSPTNPLHRELIARVLPPAAEKFHVALLPLELRSPSDVQAAVDAAISGRADGLYVLADVLTFIHRARIADLAAKNRLPALYGFRSAVDSGGLMSYGPQLRELFRRAASYVDKILKGTKPGELPVEQPTKYELVVNLKTARALGLSMPPALLRRADLVLE
ncbi:MAG TPA: ABC transporter substrate-binding protein [Methylomirabilota bacterium]|nr:ABC transporter substrate-binding protein [Methylomirabilota bacterium]